VKSVQIVLGLPKASPGPRYQVVGMRPGSQNAPANLKLLHVYIIFEIKLACMRAQSVVAFIYIIYTGNISAFLSICTGPFRYCIPFMHSANHIHLKMQVLSPTGRKFTTYHSLIIMILHESLIWFSTIIRTPNTYLNYIQQTTRDCCLR
jgi:hypothetical protein